MSLTGKLTGIPSRKPIGFFPVFSPSPRRGEENRKTEVGNSGQASAEEKKETGKRMAAPHGCAARTLSPARAFPEEAGQ